MLRVNMGKTKVMLRGKGLDTIKSSGKYPCGVCRKGVRWNSVYRESCEALIQRNAVELKRGLLMSLASCAADALVQLAL